MTGYGDAERDSPAGRLRMEVKTVNHRFFNPSVKTPHGLDRLEPQIVAVLKERIARGHVNAWLTLDRDAADDSQARVDLERAAQYVRALEALREELGVEGRVDLGVLARFPDVFREPDRGTPDLDPELVRGLAADAVDEVVRLREAEGERLREDLAARLDRLADLLDAIEARAPERLVRERDRLREAVSELSERVEVDEERLAREIAHLAERWDIAEEIVRFRSHLELFRETLDGAADEPAGKRLGFLVQEMHREANTVGAKANDAEISHAAMAVKEEIERIREQVENVE